MTISVLLVDDQPLLRVGFRMVLESQEDLTVLGEAGDGAEAVRLTIDLDPDVVLMDVRMPSMDGIEATRQIVAAGSRSRVLILTTFDLDEYAFAALRAGASGFLLKNVPPGHLLTAIRAVASGHAVVAANVTRRLLNSVARRLPQPAPVGVGPDAPLAELTKRVARLVADRPAHPRRPSDTRRGSGPSAPPQRLALLRPLAAVNVAGRHKDPNRYRGRSCQPGRTNRALGDDHLAAGQAIRAERG
jgi:DNA-binding NarL/FixJ family response regulator